MSTTIKFDQAEFRDGWLCLKPCEYVDTVNAKAFCFGFKGVYDAELKRHYNKRSLNSNNYAWQLITKIGNELRQDKDAVYFELLKRYGQGGAVSVQERFAEQFKRTNKYNESLGKSMLNGLMWEHFRFWIGSSQYNSQEMSIFIEGIVDEAKSLGIETLTPDELARMNLEWDNEGSG